MNEHEDYSGFPENVSAAPSITPPTVQTVSAPAYHYVPPAKRVWDFQNHDGIFAWLALPLGFLFVRYVMVMYHGFATTAFFLLMLIAAAVYVKLSGHKITAPQAGLWGIIALFTLPFSLTTTTTIRFLCVVFLLIATVWWVRAVTIGTSFVTRFFPYDAIDSVVTYPCMEMKAAPKAISYSMKRSKKGSNVRMILIGLLVTIPLTAIVAALLCSADAGISRIFNTIARSLSDDFSELFWEAVIGIPVGFALFAAFYGNADKKLHPHTDDSVFEEKLAKKRIIPNLGLYAAVTPICVLYLMYVISQLTYFCAAFSGILPENMESYAEYARRGFFELCAIAVINLIVILVLTGCSKEGGQKRPAALKFYASALCLFTLFIIATAIAKMVMYIDNYGLTSLRLYTAWFMVLLAFVFLVVLIRQFVKLPSAKILTSIFLVMFGLLCFSRPDAMIMEYNITRYEQHTLKDLDLDLLQRNPSDDIVMVLCRHMDTVAAVGKTSELQNAIIESFSAYSATPIRLWNFSSLWIHSHMAEYYAQNPQSHLIYYPRHTRLILNFDQPCQADSLYYEIFACDGSTVYFSNFVSIDDPCKVVIDFKCNVTNLKVADTMLDFDIDGYSGPGVPMKLDSNGEMYCDVLISDPDNVRIIPTN